MLETSIEDILKSMYALKGTNSSGHLHNANHALALFSYLLTLIYLFTHSLFNNKME